MDHTKATILVLDDDREIQTFVEVALNKCGYKVLKYGNPLEALKDLKKWSDPISSQPQVKLIISDIQLPDMDGLVFVEEVKKIESKIPIILMTAFGNLDNAVKAIRLGAFDFLPKPLSIPEMQISVERAINFHNLENENRALREEVTRNWKMGDIIGKSPKMQIVFDLIRRVARTSANILITGESGTGKELVAKAVHLNGPRADKPFVAVNCSAIPDALLESELFGHAKGSFTDALQSRKGLFQEAAGGTIFLDEIGDMSIGLQAKLLRVLQDKKVKPVGENNYIQVDTRILAATHRDLKTEITKNRFREDLYYRLSVIPIHIAPLRERHGDIPILAKHFLKKFSALHNPNVTGFTNEAMAKLNSNPWQGNVRELENLIERLVILTTTDIIGDAEIPVGEMAFENEFKQPIDQELLSLKELEKRYVSFILEKTGGKKEKAAQILKIDRKTLYRKAIDYGLHHKGSDSEEDWNEESTLGETIN